VGFSPFEGYHCVELSTDDGVDGGMSSADMIAFTLADGRRFAYGRLPFGVTDGSSIFSKLLARTIRSENAHARGRASTSTTSSLVLTRSTST